MTAEEFVQAIDLAVAKVEYDIILRYLTNRDSVRNWPKYQKLNDWFNHLSADDQEKISILLKDAIRFALAGFFLVLEGDRQIEGIGEKGQLQLIYKKGELEINLNDPINNIYGEFLELHDWRNEKID